MRRSLLAILLVGTTTGVVLVGTTGVAFAEPVAPATDEAAQVIVTDQYGQPVQQQQQPYYGQPVQQQPVQSQPVTAQQGRGLQYGASLFSPIWTGRLGDQVLPGLGISGRIGWELGGGLSLEAGLGVQWNATRDTSTITVSSMTNVFFMGGVRYGFLNPTRLVPFIQGGLQLNFWNFCDSYGYCDKYSHATFGFYGGAGLTFELNYNAALELGANFAYSFRGTVFDSYYTPLVSISPFLGLTLYY